VRIVGAKSLQPGVLTEVQITAAGSYDLEARLTA